MNCDFFDIQLFAEEASADAVSDTPAEAPTAQSTHEEFKELIKGKYKEESSKYIQGIINERFKKYKEMEERSAILSPAIEALAKSKGVDHTDTQGIAKMLSDALESNRPVEKPMLNNEQRALYTQRMREGIAQQFKALEERYPNADIASAIEDPKFVKIMTASDATTAFTAIYSGQITRDAISQTAQRTRQMMANDILARGMRPQEGSISSFGGGQRKADPSRMTREQRESLERRALRGERITI